MYRELSFKSVRRVCQQPCARVLLVLLAALTLVSCADETVPSNAVLDISPKSHSVQITELIDDAQRCVFTPENFMDIPLVLQLTTVDGSPIGGSPILVYADFSGNTYPGYPVLALYEDLNSNGVIDSDVELISGTDDDIAEVKSGKFNGAKTLLLRVNLSCSFRGEIRAIAGGISESSVIEVNSVATVSAATTVSRVANTNATITKTLSAPSGVAL